MQTPYMGSILWVDLTHGTLQEQSLPASFYAQQLSGLGLAVAQLLDRIPRGADPLGPDNVLAFVSGLLTGCGSLFTGRWMVAGKSPLTGGWGDANCGGNFAPAIKRCGYDGIFFSGVSPRPVYLRVSHGRAELCDAREVWGQDTLASERVLIEQNGGTGVRVACIGPAGEKQSLIAGVANDRGRMAARAGLGAVMGAKRLKAVVLSGARRIRAHDPKAIKALSRDCIETLRFDEAAVSNDGTGKICDGRPLPGIV